MHKFSQANLQSKLRPLAYLCCCYWVKLSYNNKAWKFNAQGARKIVVCDDNGFHGYRLSPAASEETVRRARRDRAVFSGPPEHDGSHQRAAEKVRAPRHVTSRSEFIHILSLQTRAVGGISKQLLCISQFPAVFPLAGWITRWENRECSFQVKENWLFKWSHIKYRFKMHE